MEWMNIHVGTVDSEAFMASEPADQATWVLLMRYCCGQENGGRIKNCREWPERTWRILCRVEREQVLRESSLWKWDGNDLLVSFYPEQQERELQAKRRGGRKGQRILQDKLKGNHRGNLTGDPAAELTRKGREGKERELEGKVTGVGSEGFATVPSDEEVLDFASKWQGELASGTPIMPREWVIEWLRVMNRRSGGWPLQWERALVASWRAEHRSYTELGSGAGAKNGEKPPTAWGLKQRLDLLRQKEREHPANETSSAHMGEVSPEEQAELDGIRAEIRDLEGKVVA